MKLQELDPQDARMCLGMLAFVEHELGVDLRGRSLLLALSGGADSTALLVMLCALRDYARLEITAAHLDHGLRPGSAAEAEAVEALCRGLGVAFRGARLDVAARAERDGMGLEEAGRAARYAFLEETRREIGAEWILTAHHAGDLAEDILLRLTRGASWPGLGGMPGKRGNILRPLLMLEKDSLTAMLCRLGMDWKEDESNRSRDFRRNRIRMDVLPLLLDENPNFHESVRTLWRTARMDEEYWRERLAGCIREEGGAWFLPREELLALPKAARLRAYVQAVRRIGQGQARASVLYGLDDAVMSGRHGKIFQFSGNIKASVEERGILVYIAAYSGASAGAISKKRTGS